MDEMQTDTVLNHVVLPLLFLLLLLMTIHLLIATHVF